MRRHLPILLLLGGYLLLGTLFAIFTPDWQAPDEPAHYNYVRQLAAGTLPRIEPSDYNEAYRNEVVSARFAPPYSVDNFTYEDWQPPLYYLLLTPFYWLSGGSLLVLRLVTMALGAGVVILAYALGLRLFPEVRWPALTMAAFVGFVPQHVALLSAVNNDALAELLIAAQLLVALTWLQFPNPKARSQRRTLLLLGVLLGLGLLTKATAYLMAPLVGVLLLWYFRDDRPGLLRAGALVGTPALLLGLVWWTRNLLVYPGFDPLGTAAHDAVVVGQLRTADWLADNGAGAGVGQFLTTTFRSFWGQFGWMAAPLPAWAYWPLLLFTGLTLLGLGRALYRRRSSPPPTLSRMAHRDRLMRLTVGYLLALLVALNLVLYLGYNVRFVQHQGRYLFPSLVALAAGVVVGWQGLLGEAFARRQAVRYGFPLVLAGLLFVLGLYALFFTVVPALSY